MNFYGLSLKDLAVAALIGLVIAGVFTYATAPRMVEIPIQTITPVPTPPATIHTEPYPAGGSGGGELGIQEYCAEVTGTANMAVWAFCIFAVVIFVGCLFTSNGAGMIIQLIITLLVVGVLVMILPSIVTSICEAAPMVVQP